MNAAWIRQNAAVFWPICLGSVAIAYGANAAAGNLASVPSYVKGYAGDSSMGMLEDVYRGWLIQAAAYSLTCLPWIISGVLLIRRGLRRPLLFFTGAYICLAIALPLVTPGSGFLSRQSYGLFIQILSAVIGLAIPLLLAAALNLGFIRKALDQWRQIRLSTDRPDIPAWPVALGCIAAALGAAGCLSSVSGIAWDAVGDAYQGIPDAWRFRIPNYIAAVASGVMCAAGFALLVHRRRWPLVVYIVAEAFAVLASCGIIMWGILRDPSLPSAYSRLAVIDWSPLWLPYAAQLGMPVFFLICLTVGRPRRQLREWAHPAPATPVPAPLPVSQEIL